MLKSLVDLLRFIGCLILFAFGMLAFLWSIRGMNPNTVVIPDSAVAVMLFSD